MLIDIKKLSTILKQTGFRVAQDTLPTEGNLPHISYHSVTRKNKRASNAVFAKQPLYQVSLFTYEPLNDIKALEAVLDGYGVKYTDFGRMEEDDGKRIYHFYSYVRCIE